MVLALAAVLAVAVLAGQAAALQRDLRLDVQAGGAAFTAGGGGSGDGPGRLVPPSFCDGAGAGGTETATWRLPWAPQGGRPSGPLRHPLAVTALETTLLVLHVEPGAQPAGGTVRLMARPEGASAGEVATQASRGTPGFAGAAERHMRFARAEAEEVLARDVWVDAEVAGIGLCTPTPRVWLVADTTRMAIQAPEGPRLVAARHEADNGLLHVHLGHDDPFGLAAADLVDWS